MTSSSPRRAAARSRAVSRRASTLAALGLSALAFGPVAAAQASPIQAPTTYTWSGADTSALDWATADNWSASNGPSADSSSNFVFPSVASCDPQSACGNSDNTLTGITAASLSIDSGYNLTGNAITLGGTGSDAAPLLTAQTSESTSQPATVIQTPFLLGADQTWSIDGTNFGGLTFQPDPNDPTTNGSGNITGSAYSLGLNLSNGAQFSSSSDTEVGAFTATGHDPSAVGTLAGNNGAISLQGASLNGSDHNPVNLNHVQLVASPGTTNTVSTGPLTSVGSQLYLAPSNTSAVTLVPTAASPNASAVALDGDSATSMAMHGTGATAGSDYPQITATGSVQLNGSLNVDAQLQSPSTCPSFGAGQVDTLITSTGALTGTFTNLPDGSVFDVYVGCTDHPTVPTRINYTDHAVTLTFLDPTTTTESASPSPSVTNQSVTLTATIASQDTSAPTGTVSFNDAGAVIPDCSAQTVSPLTHTATCVTNTLTSLDYISADYTPDTGSNFAGSSSDPSQVTVNPDNTTTALTASSTGPSAGDSVTYTASTSAVHSGPNTPQGAIQFLDGGPHRLRYRQRHLRGVPEPRPGALHGQLPRRGIAFDHRAIRR